MSPKRGTKLDQIVGFPDQVGIRGLGMLATGGTEFFGTTRYGAKWEDVLLGGSVAATNGRIKAWPIPIPEPVTVDALRIYVGTAADSGDQVRLGIYLGDGVGGQPSTLVAGTGLVAIDTTGTKDGTFTAITLSPGLYWFAILGANIVGVTVPAFRGTLADVHVPYFADNDIAGSSFENTAWGYDPETSTLPDPFGGAPSWATKELLYIQARVA